MAGRNGMEMEVPMDASGEEMAEYQPDSAGVGLESESDSESEWREAVRRALEEVKQPDVGGRPLIYLHQ